MACAVVAPVVAPDVAAEGEDVGDAEGIGGVWVGEALALGDCPGEPGVGVADGETSLGVAVSPDGPPRSGQELHGPDGPVEPWVAVERAAVGVRDSGEAAASVESYAVNRRDGFSVLGHN